MEILEVHTSEYKIAQAPQVLRTTGIGSCIALCLYDRARKTGGLAHIMLPSSSDWQALSENTPPARFSDTAIKAMLAEFQSKGISPAGLEAKIAGGAHMFKSIKTDAENSLGSKNADAVRENLKIAGIRLLKADTGGDVGRSLTFDLETGTAEVITKM